MLDIQVSYMRMLIGDNDPNNQRVSDATIRDFIRLAPPRSGGGRGILARDRLQLIATGPVAAVTYPSDVSGGPFTGPF